MFCTSKQSYTCTNMHASTVYTQKKPSFLIFFSSYVLGKDASSGREVLKVFLTHLLKQTVTVNVVIMFLDNICRIINHIRLCHTYISIYVIRIKLANDSSRDFVRHEGALALEWGTLTLCD